MKQMHKRILASVVVTAMICSTMSVGAIAAENSEDILDTTVSETVTESSAVMEPESATENGSEVTAAEETPAQAEETPEETAGQVTDAEQAEENQTEEETAAQEEETVESENAEPEAKASAEAPTLTEESGETAETPAAPEMPLKPNTDGMSASEANEAIDAYNAAIQEYNKKVDEYNAAVDAKYELEKQEVADHNSAEQEKVKLSEEAIAAYEKLKEKQDNNEKLTVEFDKKGIDAHRTEKADELPTTWKDYVVDADQAKTIKVEKSDHPSGETYYVINIHIYLDEAYEGGYIGTSIKDNEFLIAQEKKDHLVRAEWEAVLVDKNDIVTVHDQSSNMGSKSMAFYRYMPGYVNGFWIGGSEFASTCNNTEWILGGQIFSYDSGTTDGEPIKNVFNMNCYTFRRTGAELTVGDRPDEYIANYLEDPTKGELLAHLDAMDRVEEEPEEPVTPEEPEEPTPDPEEPVTPEQPEEPTPVPEEPTTPEQPEEPEVSEVETEPTENDLPQTGQDWTMASVLFIAGVSVLVFGSVRKRRMQED